MKVISSGVFILFFSLYFPSICVGEVSIEQVSPTAVPVDGSDKKAFDRLDSEASGGADFQNEVLSNPTYNAAARVNYGGTGNEAGQRNLSAVVQNGGPNRAVVSQSGSRNSADVKQKGAANALIIDQKGSNNSYVEEQTGDNNFKFIRQNDGREETVIIEQVGPTTKY